MASFGVSGPDFDDLDVLWAEGMGGNELCRRLGADPVNAGHFSLSGR
jgi:hypothetical protein